MKWDIDLSDLKESAVRRMLREAISKETDRSKPASKRDKELQAELEEAADDENDKLVEMSASKGESSPIPVSEEDVSDEANDSLKKKPRMAASKSPKKVKS